MNELCKNRVYSEEYQDYLVDYFGDVTYLEELYPEDCFQTISERFAIAYREGDEVENRLNGGAYIVPKCYGLMSSENVLQESGITRVRNQPALNLYGQGVLVGFIDTGDGV